MRLSYLAILFILFVASGSLLAEDSVPERFQQISVDFRRALNAGSLQDLRQSAADLEALMVEAGFVSAEGLSGELLKAGMAAAQRGNTGYAEELLQIAERLSPSSPVILLRSVPLKKELRGSGAGLLQMLNGLQYVWGSPALMLHGLVNIIYPVMWALTFALYAAFALYFMYHIQDILRKSARLFPVSLRGLLVPVAVLAALCVPCFLGPLWCLAAWACLFCFLVPGRRWVGLCTGLLLLAWSGAITVRENLASWLQEPGVEAMLRVHSGVFDRHDKQLLAKLSADRPADGAAAYAYAQVLKRYEEYAEADRVFARAGELLGRQPYTKAERGLMAFLLGKDAEAERLMAEAEKDGLASASFFLNYSKVKFEAMEVQSSLDYYKKAREKDRERVELFKSRENRVGVRSVKSSADILLPTRFILFSSLKNAPSGARSSRMASALLRGFTPGSLAILGGVLIGLFIITGLSAEAAARARSYYREYEPSCLLLWLLRIVPGGAWIPAQKPALTFVSLTASFILLMPLLGFPAESNLLLAAVADFYWGYLPSAAAVIGVVTICCNYLAKEAE